MQLRVSQRPDARGMQTSAGAGEHAQRRHRYGEVGGTNAVSTTSSVAPVAIAQLSWLTPYTKLNGSRLAIRSPPVMPR